MFGPLTSRDALFDVPFRHQTPRLTPPNVSLWREIQRVTDLGHLNRLILKRGRVRVRRRGYDHRAFAANPRRSGTPGDADDIRRRDKILRPLSLAIPDLRIHMHSDEDGNDFERAASMHWWHARCGLDWWDFVFFAPPPEDYIF